MSRLEKLQVELTKYRMQLSKSLNQYQKNKRSGL